MISIHALLAESDEILYQRQIYQKNFYPRSPCGERRIGLARMAPYAYFYPRSPCGERQGEKRANQSGHCISIHALLAESDNCTSIGRPKRLYFYPRSPCGERHAKRWKSTERPVISIHALLAESDCCSCTAHNRQSRFLSTLSLRRAT